MRQAWSIWILASSVWCLGVGLRGALDGTASASAFVRATPLPLVYAFTATCALANVLLLVEVLAGKLASPTRPEWTARYNVWRAYRSDLADYMHRWIIATPFGSLRLHHILRSDEGEDLHDHAWHFVSIILTGGYTEVLDGGVRHWRRPLSVRFVFAETAHRLILDRPVWTLCIAGPAFRSWGFYVDGKWVDAKTFRAANPRHHWPAESISAPAPETRP